MNLQLLFEQQPILESLLPLLGPPELFILRYIVRGIGRPKYQQLAAFAERGDLRLLKWAYQHTSELRRHRTARKAFKVAAKHGHIEIIKWCETLPHGLPKNVAANALIYGQLELVKYLHSAGRLGKNVLRKAECSGSIELVEWLLEHEYKFDKNAGETAARFGHVHLIKWMLQHPIGEPVSKFTARHAARAGHADVFELLHEFGFHLDDAILNAAMFSKLEVLQRAHDLGYKFNSSHLNAAAEGGDIATFDWMLGHGAPLDPKWTLLSAVRSNREMVQHVLRCGARWDAFAGNMAAVFGNIDVVKFALENGLEINLKECKVSLGPYESARLD
jgi:hypothetical protein